MGISYEEILEMLRQLQKAIAYWKECQPHLVPEELESKVSELEVLIKNKVQA